MYGCLVDINISLFFFFFKQKTAYEMRISDWSSDVCSSDLGLAELKQEYGDPQQRFLKLFEMLATIFTGGPRDEVRLVTVHAILSGRTTLTGQIYDDMDKEVHSTILNLLREFQSDGYFLEDVEIEPLARLMYRSEEHTSDLQSLMRISY